MVIGWPQGILLAIYILSVGICMARYGEPKHDTYDLIDVMIAPGIVLALLYWGGFFTGGCN